MLITILLTLCNIILLCLMILTATVLMPYRGLAKNFPKDMQEALKPRLDEIDKQPKAPRIFGGVDGVHHDFTYSQYLLRFLIIAFGTKTFEIIALDYFLLTKTYFFPISSPKPKAVQAGSNSDITENSISDKVYLC